MTEWTKAAVSPEVWHLTVALSSVVLKKDGVVVAAVLDEGDADTILEALEALEEVKWERGEAK